ncbi:hypothetical protein BSQ97_24145 [Serratia proteamaculans]|nr:hypothetical protein BSQ96_23545 [Serratia proteamaculans]RYM47769.1 hypothetical protein BSQ97_24145 [Serratia proteamaculans]
MHPMYFNLQLGDQLAHPQALTLVSNWGELVQITTLQFERRRVSTTQHLTGVPPWLTISTP